MTATAPQILAAILGALVAAAITVAAVAARRHRAALHQEYDRPTRGGRR